MNKIDQTLPAAAYAPIFHFSISDRDVIFTFTQPTTEKDKQMMIARIAMPINSAYELVSLLGNKLPKRDIPTEK